MDAAISSAIAADGNLLNGGSVRSTGGSADNSGTIDIFQTSVTDSGQLNIFNSSDERTVSLDPDFGITLGNGNTDNRDMVLFFDNHTTQVSAFQVRNTGKFTFRDESSDFMTLNASELNLSSPAKFEGSDFTILRGADASTNTTNYRIEGILPGTSSVTGGLITIKRTSGTGGDTFQYFGRTDTNDNAIQNRGSVIGIVTTRAITDGDWDYINKSNGTGSTLDGFYLVEYKRDQCGDSGDYMVTIIVNATDSTDNLQVGDVVCKLPAGYRPGTHSSGMGFVPIFQLVNADSATAIGTCMVQADGSIKFIALSGVATKQMFGQCTFTTHSSS